jgi:hypothetical protein
LAGDDATIHDRGALSAAGRPAEQPPLSPEGYASPSSFGGVVGATYASRNQCRDQLVVEIATERDLCSFNPVQLKRAPRTSTGRAADKSKLLKETDLVKPIWGIERFLKSRRSSLIESPLRNVEN